MVVPFVHNKFVRIALVVGIVVLFAAPSVYFYGRYKDAQSKLANPVEAAKADAKGLVGIVGKIMELPSDEDPTVATVSDIAKLQNQPFFTNAQNGDKVLIYSKAKKAILYRPGNNKIIEVAAINLGGAQASPSSQIAQVKGVQTMSAVLRNGTSVVGLTKKIEDELKTKAPNITVSDRDNAKRSDWAKSIVIDVTGTKAAAAAQLAATLGITVGPMPKGEASVSADFLIILGADQK